MRAAGIVTALAGLVFLIIGLVGFFSGFGNFGPPKNVWCLFVGIPLLGVGAILIKMGYVGAIACYIATETAPVAADAFNEVADGIQPGVRKLSRSVAEGFADADKPRDEPK